MQFSWPEQDCLQCAKFSIKVAGQEGFQKKEPKGAALLTQILRKNMNCRLHFYATGMVSCLWCEHQDSFCSHTPVPIRINCSCDQRHNSHCSWPISYTSSWHFISDFFFFTWKDILMKKKKFWKQNKRNFYYRYTRLNDFLTVEFIHCLYSTALCLWKLKCKDVADMGTLLLFLTITIYYIYFRAFDHFCDFIFIMPEVLLD